MVYKPGNEATWAIHVDHRSTSLPGAAGKLFLHGCELKKSGGVYGYPKTK